MHLGGAPLEIDAIPGELDAERRRYRDPGKTRTSHESGCSPSGQTAPDRVAGISLLTTYDFRLPTPDSIGYPLIPLSIRLLMIWRRPMMKTTSTGRLAMTAIASIWA